MSRLHERGAPGAHGSSAGASKGSTVVHAPGRADGSARAERLLREALEANGQRYTDQRAAVFRCLLGTDQHPSADDVFTAVRQVIPDISLATVYKSLETLVSCGLASKLTYGDGSARYDGRTDPHPHARCLTCGTVLDLPGRLDSGALASLGELPGFSVEGYRVEVVGVCHAC
jgi:Fur family transcriptional regulator, peroxide stress response regulator